VTVPVGGVIELEIEVDREGLGRVGGMEMSIIQEIEIEDIIKHKIVNSFRRVRCYVVGADDRIPRNWLLRKLGLMGTRRPISSDHSLRVRTGLVRIPPWYPPTNL
jgi:hypothetical protein